MSRNQPFNNSTNLGNDEHYLDCLNSSNNKMSEYVLADFHSRFGDKHLNEPGMYRDAHIAVRTKDVDNSSSIRNGAMMTKDKCKSGRQLDTRVFKTMPYTGAGSGTTQVDLENELRKGSRNHFERSKEEYEQRSTFIPLIDSIKDDMENVDNFVERNWVRGGMSSRSVKQNINYAKCQGLQ